jgi:hypothetical protein
MKTLLIISIISIVSVFSSCTINKSLSSDRGEVGTYKNKFIWNGTGQAFVPNYIMLEALTLLPDEAEIISKHNLPFKPKTSDLRYFTEENLDRFIDEFIHGHGFNGVHVSVCGQWFHIGDHLVTENDTVPDPRTFEKMAMIIRKVYEAGGSTYFWLWGDHQRKWTTKSTKDGIMGKQEQLVLDMIAEKLGPLKGWYIGYGFDLFEWVTEEDLKKWHDYMWSKPGWSHLLGARSPAHTKLEQIYEGLDFSDYCCHKPWYDKKNLNGFINLVEMINARPTKPSLSGDRYRIRRNPPYRLHPEKDYNEEETRRGLWHHTMAGGVGAIWGHMDSPGIYPNKEELKCFSVFWNDNNRFRKDMVTDNSLTNGWCLRESDNYYVFYKENTGEITYSFSGKPKKVIAVDTRKKYQEIELGKKKSGNHVFNAPYVSDWAIAVE